MDSLYEFLLDLLTTPGKLLDWIRDRDTVAEEADLSQYSTEDVGECMALLRDELPEEQAALLSEIEQQLAGTGAAGDGGGSRSVAEIVDDYVAPLADAFPPEGYEAAVSSAGVAGVSARGGVAAPPQPPAVDSAPPRAPEPAPVAVDSGQESPPSPGDGDAAPPAPPPVPGEPPDQTAEDPIVERDGAYYLNIRGVEYPVSPDDAGGYTVEIDGEQVPASYHHRALWLTHGDGEVPLAYQGGEYVVTVDGARGPMTLDPDPDGSLHIDLDGARYEVTYADGQVLLQLAQYGPGAPIAVEAGNLYVVVDGYTHPVELDAERLVYELDGEPYPLTYDARGYTFGYDLGEPGQLTLGLGPDGGYVAHTVTGVVPVDLVDGQPHVTLNGLDLPAEYRFGRLWIEVNGDDYAAGAVDGSITVDIGGTTYELVAEQDEVYLELDDQLYEFYGSELRGVYPPDEYELDVREVDGRLMLVSVAPDGSVQSLALASYEGEQMRLHLDGDPDGYLAEIVDGTVVVQVDRGYGNPFTLSMAADGSKTLLADSGTEYPVGYEEGSLYVYTPQPYWVQYEDGQLTARIGNDQHPLNFDGSDWSVEIAAADSTSVAVPLGSDEPFEIVLEDASGDLETIQLRLEGNALLLPTGHRVGIEAGRLMLAEGADVALDYADGAYTFRWQEELGDPLTVHLGEGEEEYWIDGVDWQGNPVQLEVWVDQYSGLRVPGVSDSHRIYYEDGKLHYLVSPAESGVARELTWFDGEYRLIVEHITASGDTLTVLDPFDSAELGDLILDTPEGPLYVPVIVNAHDPAALRVRLPRPDGGYGTVEVEYDDGQLYLTEEGTRYALSHQEGQYIVTADDGTDYYLAGDDDTPGFPFDYPVADGPPLPVTEGEDGQSYVTAVDANGEPGEFPVEYIDGQLYVVSHNGQLIKAEVRDGELSVQNRQYGPYEPTVRIDGEYWTVEDVVEADYVMYQPAGGGYRHIQIRDADGDLLFVRANRNPTRPDSELSVYVGDTYFLADLVDGQLYLLHEGQQYPVTYDDGWYTITRHEDGEPVTYVVQGGNHEEGYPFNFQIDGGTEGYEPYGDYLIRENDDGTLQLVHAGPGADLVYDIVVEDGQYYAYLTDRYRVPIAVEDGQLYLVEEGQRHQADIEGHLLRVQYTGAGDALELDYDPRDWSRRDFAYVGGERVPVVLEDGQLYVRTSAGGRIPATYQDGQLIVHINGTALVASYGDSTVEIDGVTYTDGTHTVEFDGLTYTLQEFEGAVYLVGEDGAYQIGEDGLVAIETGGFAIRGEGRQAEIVIQQADGTVWTAWGVEYDDDGQLYVLADSSLAIPIAAEFVDGELILTVPVDTDYLGSDPFTIRSGLDQKLYVQTADGSEIPIDLHRRELWVRYSDDEDGYVIANYLDGELVISGENKLTYVDGVYGVELTDANGTTNSYALSESFEIALVDVDGEIATHRLTVRTDGLVLDLPDSNLRVGIGENGELQVALEPDGSGNVYSAALDYEDGRYSFLYADGDTDPIRVHLDVAGNQYIEMLDYRGEPVTVRVTTSSDGIEGPGAMISLVDGQFVAGSTPLTVVDGEVYWVLDYEPVDGDPAKILRHHPTAYLVGEDDTLLPIDYSFESGLKVGVPQPDGTVAYVPVVYQDGNLHLVAGELDETGPFTAGSELQLEYGDGQYYVTDPATGERYLLAGDVDDPDFPFENAEGADPADLAGLVEIDGQYYVEVGGDRWPVNYEDGQLSISYVDYEGAPREMEIRIGEDGKLFAAGDPSSDTSFNYINGEYWRDVSRSNGMAQSGRLFRRPGSYQDDYLLVPSETGELVELEADYSPDDGIFRIRTQYGSYDARVTVVNLVPQVYLQHQGGSYLMIHRDGQWMVSRMEDGGRVEYLLRGDPSDDDFLWGPPEYESEPHFELRELDDGSYELVYLGEGLDRVYDVEVIDGEYVATIDGQPHVIEVEDGQVYLVIEGERYQTDYQDGRFELAYPAAGGETQIALLADGSLALLTDDGVPIPVAEVDGVLYVEIADGSSLPLMIVDGEPRLPIGDTGYPFDYEYGNIYVKPPGTALRLEVVEVDGNMQVWFGGQRYDLVDVDGNYYLGGQYSNGSSSAARLLFTPTADGEITYVDPLTGETRTLAVQVTNEGLQMVVTDDAGNQTYWPLRVGADGLQLDLAGQPAPVHYDDGVYRVDVQIGGQPVSLELGPDGHYLLPVGEGESVPIEYVDGAFTYNGEPIVYNDGEFMITTDDGLVAVGAEEDGATVYDGYEIVEQDGVQYLQVGDDLYELQPDDDGYFVDYPQADGDPVRLFVKPDGLYIVAEGVTQSPYYSPVGLGPDGGLTIGGYPAYVDVGPVYVTGPNGTSRAAYQDGQWWQEASDGDLRLYATVPDSSQTYLLLATDDDGYSLAPIDTTNGPNVYFPATGLHYPIYAENGHVMVNIVPGEAEYELVYTADGFAARVPDGEGGYELRVLTGEAADDALGPSEPTNGEAEETEEDGEGEAGEENGNGAPMPDFETDTIIDNGDGSYYLATRVGDEPYEIPLVKMGDTYYVEVGRQMYELVRDGDDYVIIDVADDGTETRYRVTGDPDAPDFPFSQEGEIIYQPDDNGQDDTGDGDDGSDDETDGFDGDGDGDGDDGSDSEDDLPPLTGDPPPPPDDPPPQTDDEGPPAEDPPTVLEPE